MITLIALLIALFVVYALMVAIIVGCVGIMIAYLTRKAKPVTYRYAYSVFYNGVIYHVYCKR